MLDAVFGIFLNLLFFFIIGFWPTFWLSSSKNRLLIAVAVAPTTGFAITSIVATYLVLMDYPIKTWSQVYASVCIVISIVILLYYIIKKRSELTGLISEEKDITWLLVGFMAVILLVGLPMLLGGAQFTTLRGNGTDAFNYMTMARYLDREPYSWRNIASTAELIEKDRSYALAIKLINTRWTTSAMLAYTSRIANLPIYQFEYPYTLLFFIMAFGPSYILGRRLRLNQYFSLAVALVISSGFWAQFVLDIRAFSEINSIPLILAIGYFMVETVDQKDSLFYKEPILLGILSVSLLFSYIEIVPLYVLSVVLSSVILLLKRELRLNLLAPLGVVLTIVALLSSPQYSLLSKFIFSQLHYASSVPNNWDRYYYPWLYNNPLIGFWGLTPLTFLSYNPALLSLGKIIEYLLMAIGSILFLIIFLYALRLLVYKKADIPLVFVLAFAVATLMEFLFLYTKSQLWAAGKSLAFGYPFFILLVTGMGLGTNWLSSHRFMHQGCKLTITFWVILQICLGLARINVATSGTEFVNYTGNHGEYRTHDYDLSPIYSVLKDGHRATIWVVIPNAWVAEYLNLAFGQNHQVVDTLGVVDHYGEVSGYQEMNNLPDYLLVERRSLDYNKDWEENVVAENSDFVLLKLRQRKFVFVLITNPNGIEKWGGEMGFWVGGGKTVINIISSVNAQVGFTADFIPGPSVSDQSYRKLAVFDPTGNSQILTITKSTKELFFTVHKGRNEVVLNDLDIPTATLSNGDKRSLLLGITHLNIGIVK